jgi:surfeit locus 1 family protein
MNAMKRRFRPALVPTLAVALLLPAFLAMGYWQWQRAGEKRALQTEYDSRAGAGAVKIAPRLQRAGDLRFHRVTARGYFDTSYQVLLDNRVHRGVAGYHVITPLRIEGSEVRVLVNRGWIPLGPGREPLPAVETPAGLREVGGIATVPAERAFTLGTSEGLRRGRPAVWQRLDMKRFTETAPFPVQPVVVLLDAGHPDGFARDWTRLDAGIAVHEGYAFQWLALSAALLAVYLAWGVRRGAAGGGDVVSGPSREGLS